VPPGVPGIQTLQSVVVKRRVCKFGLLLLAGAIVNVAVAWGCTYHTLNQNLFFMFQDVESHEAEEIRSFVPPYVDRDFNGEISADEHLYFGVRHRWYMPRYRHLNGGPEYFAFRIEAGWPLLSVEGVSGRDTKSVVPGVLITRENGALRLKVSSRRWPYDVIPYKPIWSGFAINTIFYAAILWLLSFAPGAVRRRLIIRGRRRRGLCPACAYPIGTSPVCTECGNTVNARTCMGLPPPATPAQGADRTT
jgi:hypothetical protein